jgi:hypothetical protein
MSVPLVLTPATKWVMPPCVWMIAPLPTERRVDSRKARKVSSQLRWITCSQEDIEHRRFSFADVT